MKREFNYLHLNRQRGKAMHFKKQINLVNRMLQTLTIATAGIALNAVAQTGVNTCGGLTNHYGPFDYRTSNLELRERIEKFHFTPQVESLIKGQSGFKIGPDLNYTLRVFPNHPRALLSLMRYGEKLKSPQPQDVPLPIDCYFERALRFQPDDTTVRMIHATFLSANGRAPEALAELNKVITTAPDNPFTQYNVGLIYLDMKEYDKALVQAHKAIVQGFPQTGLRDKLAAVGKWQAPQDSLIPDPVSPAQK